MVRSGGGKGGEQGGGKEDRLNVGVYCQLDWPALPRLSVLSIFACRESGSS